MLSGRRVLIIEAEFLIALDIQRILESAHAAHTVFARSVAEAETLAGRWREFDLAIVEIPFGNQSAIRLARAMRHAGVPVVVSTADTLYRRGIAELPDMPVVCKPFGEGELVEACARAAR